MGGAKSLRFSRRMEGIAQTDQTANAELVRDHAGHPPTHRLAPDKDFFTAAMLLDDAAEGIEQHRLPVRRAALPSLAPASHVRKLEPDDTNPPLAESAGDARHERRVHRPARAMGEE